MEFAAAALTSIASGAGQVGTALFGMTGAAGVPSIPGLLTGATASTAASILSGGATVLSVVNAGRAADAKSMALEAQADDAVTQSRIATLQGIDRQNSLKAAMVDRIGTRDVATAASGVDLSFGTAAIARRQEISDTERALAIDNDTTNLQVTRLSERAANYRIQARQASAGGLATAASLALEGGAKLLRRG